MNIEDVGAREMKMNLPAIDSTDRLVLIFARQTELRNKYIGIEEGNGFYCPPECPVDLHDRKDQHVLKDLAWRITEELAEAVDASNRHEDGWAHLHAREEIADAFHFLVEFSLLAGFEPLDFVDDTRPGDALTQVFSLAGYQYSVLNRVYGSSVHNAFIGLITNLGMTCHTLKNKPWKQSHMLTDQPEFHKRLQRVFISFAVFCHAIKLNDTELFDLYFKKSIVNGFRQRSEY